MSDEHETTLPSLTADIVAAHVANNPVDVTDVADLIKQVYAALSGLGNAEPAPVIEQQPAVPIRASVTPDYIVCLEDGKKLKMLRRYLRTRFNMSPDEYRAKWKLPDSYPMTAPVYAERRRAIAHSTGLGRKREAQLEVEQSAPKRRTRSKA